ncbi:LysR family transcriptional regulator [Kiloniella sp. EL199]|uniref:LysR family transcriptional regulator n=1 Tax=Kiloniella sp. EL199 TaxID=2107581 RepID=UPI0013C5356C|nr:LysR family transcriptional regulator [Kiloniella sp. EL199]
MKIFNAIYSERSISRAADHLGMSQSAVSHALQRLRHALDDPLFIRSKNGVDPTARSHEIAEPVFQALIQINDVIAQPSSFDPQTSDRVFHFGLPDHAVARYAPLILEKFTKEAPNLSINLYPHPIHQLIEMMETNQLDMAAAVCHSPPARFRTLKLFKSHHVVIAAKDHPFIRGKLSLVDYKKARHLVYSSDGNRHSYLDDILLPLGVERSIAATIASHMASPIIVSNSNLIATTTMELVQPFLERYELQVFEPPFSVHDVDIKLIWHQRYDRDPAHQWMRQLTQDITRDV